ncbi:uncharacterized protein LOC124154657 [Ischnura elegans]|uniref:uncharacterized protein LOC124154657 n=1 Tax=Ischnura elegans TaxID=197161 RepID=UPI001ED86A1B|nr:uncharacterized protein LOC124154657 [Ischnura elegans]
MSHALPWVVLLASGALVWFPLLVLGSGLEGSEDDAGPFDDGFTSPGSIAHQQQHQTLSAPVEATTTATATHMERIVSPTLGPFLPSPQIKFPEPPPQPAYGQPKIPQHASSSLYEGTADSGLRDVLTPPHQYHSNPPYHHGPPPSSFGHHQHHHHPLHHSLYPGLFHDTANNKGPSQDYYAFYDAPADDHDEQEQQVDDRHPHHFQYLPHPFPHHPGKHHPPAPDAGDADLLDKKAGKTRAWKTLVAALTTLVPIGLFLAALPPNYVTVSNATSLRSGKSEEGDEELDVEYPALDLMGRLGLGALGDPQCEGRLFCEMSRMGRTEDANAIQKILWRIVNDVPDVLTDMVGLRRLFKAARTDSCRAFKCKDTRGADD